MFEEIINRVKGLDVWVDNTGVKQEQAHLNKDSKERLYYGYLVALKDVLNLLEKQQSDIIN